MFISTELYLVHHDTRTHRHTHARSINELSAHLLRFQSNRVHNCSRHQWTECERAHALHSYIHPIRPNDRPATQTHGRNIELRTSKLSQAALCIHLSASWCVVLTFRYNSIRCNFILYTESMCVQLSHIRWLTISPLNQLLCMKYMHPYHMLNQLQESGWFWFSSISDYIWRICQRRTDIRAAIHGKW